MTKLCNILHKPLYNILYRPLFSVIRTRSTFPNAIYNRVINRIYIEASDSRVKLRFMLASHAGKARIIRLQEYQNDVDKGKQFYEV